MGCLREKKIGVRIMLGVVLGILGIGMLLYSCRREPMTSMARKIVAEVGDEHFCPRCSEPPEQEHSQRPDPPALVPISTQQALDQLINEKMLALEAARMGLRVSDEEHADLLKKLVSTAFTGDSFIGWIVTRRKYSRVFR